MDPYEEGQQLFHDMMPKFANRYKRGSAEWIQCNDGWEDARREQLKKNNVKQKQET